MSAGAEVGRQTSDTVIIFRTRKAAEKFGETPRNLTLSFGAVVWLRRRHRFVGPSSNSDEEVLVYERFRGLRVGAAISREHPNGDPLSPRRTGKTERTGEPGVAEGKAQATAARGGFKARVRGHARERLAGHSATQASAHNVDALFARAGRGDRKEG